jgi:hypothetical protein
MSLYRLTARILDRRRRPPLDDLLNRLRRAGL